MPPITSPPPLLSVEGLEVRLTTPDGPHQVIHGVDFEVRQGEILGLAGESGSGKSVTALALLRLLPAGAEVAGRISFDGVDVAQLSRSEVRRFRGTEARIIFQDPWSSLNPLLTIGRQLRSSLTALHQVSRAEADRRVLEVLERVGIPEAARRLRQHPHELSGGMLQRVMIAYALVAEPKLVICDEPTTALDVTTEAQILDLLSEINRDLGTTFILTSHDLGVLSDSCDRLMVMYAGRVIEQGTVDEVLANPHHPYSLALVSALPGEAPRQSQLRAIGGQPPSTGLLPRGCPFHPRCSFSIETCRDERPDLRPATGSSSDRRAACWLTTETPVRMMTEVRP